MELKITNLMDHVYDDSVELTAKSAVSANRVKELTLKKINMCETCENSITGEKQAQSSYRTQPRRTHMRTVRRIALIAACLAILLLGSVTVLAASGVINIREFYDSIFANPKAEKVVATGEAVSGAIEDRGIEITPLGAYVEGYNAYIRLQLRDIEGGRLSDTIYFLKDNGESVPAVVNYGTDTDSAIAIIQYDIADGDDAPTTASLHLKAICAGIQTMENLPLDFNIGTHIGITQPVVVQGAEFMAITGVETHDGKLTIHRRDNEIAQYGWGSGLLGLKAPDGTVIWETHSELDAAGNKSDDFDIGKHDPDTLSLVFNGKHATRTITGDWEIAFSTVQHIVPRTLTADFSGREAKITCGATKLEINLSPGYADGDPELKSIMNSVSASSEGVSKNGEVIYPGKDISASEDVSITLKNGEVVYPRFVAASWDSTSADFSFKMTFVPPENVQSITFLGQIFTFSD